MDSEKEYLKSSLIDYVRMITSESNRNQNQFICPLCKSGTHRGHRSTGAFTVYETNSWHCFACGETGDIFSLIGKYEGLPSFPEQLQRAKELFGNNPSAEVKTSQKNKPTPKEGQYKTEVQEWHKQAEKTDYFKQRGLTSKTVDRFCLGYDEKADRIIIPYDGEKGSYYISRRTKEKYYVKPPNKNGENPEPVFNEGALYSGEPCFICEGAIDAISIMEAGPFEAVALGGVGAEKLISLYDKDPKPNVPLIISFDNDTAGKKAAEGLKNKLEERKIPCIIAEYDFSGYPSAEGVTLKDMNDLLTADKEMLTVELMTNIERLTLAVQAKKEQEQAEEQQEKEEYYSQSGSYRVNHFYSGLMTNKPPIKTGFPELDKILDGGLYPGLYIIGAISSMGKTTFVLQLVDQIAKAGQDVLFISLEMAANELIAKSLSRLTYEFQIKEGLPDGTAKTVRGITNLERQKHYNETERDAIFTAQCIYDEECGKHIFFYEGIGDIGVLQIKELVEKHKRITGNIPVVCVDYLQILAPYDVHMSDKQNTDMAVRELKRLSRDYGIPVLAISSLNRENYSKSISMSAFKESGAIEYGSDVLIGLQPFFVEPTTTNGTPKTGAAAEAIYRKCVEKTKQDAIRQMELVILKQRNGQTGVKANFKYYSLFNYFSDLDIFSDFFTEADENDKNSPWEDENIPLA